MRTIQLTGERRKEDLVATRRADFEDLQGKENMNEHSTKD
jgi:hypothetical protein